MKTLCVKQRTQVRSTCDSTSPLAALTAMVPSRMAEQCCNWLQISGFHLGSHSSGTSSGPAGALDGADAGAVAGCLVAVLVKCRFCGGVLRFSNSAMSLDASPLVSSKTNRVMASPSL